MRCKKKYTFFLSLSLRRSGKPSYTSLNSFAPISSSFLYSNFIPSYVSIPRNHSPKNCSGLNAVNHKLRIYCLLTYQILPIFIRIPKHTPTLFFIVIIFSFFFAMEIWKLIICLGPLKLILRNMPMWAIYIYSTYL